MRIAQITDSHVVAPGTLWKGRVDMAAKLAAAVARLNALAPDLVVHTGDVVDGGGAAQYGLAAEILSDLRAPLRMVPGNHDDRARMRAAFPGQVWEGDAFLEWREDAEGLRLIGVDTVDPGRTAGRLCEVRAARLGEALAGAEAAVVFLHHPPCPMGLAQMDQFAFRGEAGAARAVSAAPPLRLACGHVHAAAERHWAGSLVAACPATGVQIPPATGEVLGFTLEPPAIRLHDWRAETGLTIKTVPVDAFPGPFPFESDPNADLSGTAHG